MLINLRNALMAGKRLPYTPVYGVRSDGVAYCALLGRINASSGAFEADFTITSSYRGDFHAFGSHGAQGNAKGFMLMNLQRFNSSNGLYCFGLYSNYSIGLKFNVGSRYVLTASQNQSGTFGTLNGSPLNTASLGTPIYNPGQFLIFRASATNSQTNPQASKSPTFIVLHRLKVWYGDTQAADLIPCRENATNEVCFFNTIDGQFVKNIAGGSSKLIEATQ